jgi:hypothetical protein
MSEGVQAEVEPVVQVQEEVQEEVQAEDGLDLFSFFDVARPSLVDTVKAAITELVQSGEIAVATTSKTLRHELVKTRHARDKYKAALKQAMRDVGPLGRKNAALTLKLERSQALGEVILDQCKESEMWREKLELALQELVLAAKLPKGKAWDKVLAEATDTLDRSLGAGRLGHS